jgi:hypothetical protein
MDPRQWDGVPRQKGQPYDPGGRYNRENRQVFASPEPAVKSKPSLREYSIYRETASGEEEDQPQKTGFQL